MDGSVWVILPTYDEAENLEAVVGGDPRGRSPTRTSSSSTTTRATAPASSPTGSPTTSLHRPGKAGLGRAYTAGFAHALDDGAGYVIEMDADLSHDPADLPRLLAPALDGADLVLGSRYVHGGGVENWGLAAAGHLARRLRVRPPRARRRVRDLTGGFKCFRADALQRDRRAHAPARRATRSRSS